MALKILSLWKRICTGMFTNLQYLQNLKYLSKFGWTQANKVQFNKSGTLLMVTGVLKVNVNKARMGEIIVYDCKGEDVGDVRSRISLK
jgi:hypothetical protein